MARNPLGDLGETLGDYLREQRKSARLSVRQLSELAGVSNPYLSQIERGLKKPSAEILQQIAKGLQVSAESLYVRAGLLDPEDFGVSTGPDTRAVIKSDPRLTSRQRAALLDVYDSFVGSGGKTEPATSSGDPTSPEPETTARPARRRATKTPDATT